MGRPWSTPDADAERLAALPQAGDLAALWLGAARMEHASVPAFAEVALLLGGLGAPLDLVAAAHAAALDEVEHTRLAYGLANAYGRTAHAPGALPRLLGRRVGSRRGSLRRVAVEALRDGCLNEGYAARLAALGAAQATDEAPRAALVTIAADEAAHTELSWRLLGWCLGTGRVTRAVERALRSLPAEAPVPTASGDLAAHGWVPPEDARAAFAEVRAEVVTRAAGLLAMAP